MTAPSPGQIAYLVGRLDRLLRRHLAEALAVHGLTLPQYTALSVLQARGTLSNARLAERSFVTPQSANEMVKVMAERGWVVREADPKHGRIVLLRLTRRGEQLIQRCALSITALETRMLHDLSERERKQLQSALRTCAHALGGHVDH